MVPVSVVEVDVPAAHVHSIFGAITHEATRGPDKGGEAKAKGGGTYAMGGVI